MQPERQVRDIFPTAYRLNTRADIARAFPPHRFDHVIYGWDPEPAYVGSSRAMTAVFSVISRITPDRLRSSLLIFLRRKPAAP
jgi:hypothetical protein